MALTTTATASTKEEWETEYYKEFIRESGFKPYMGANKNTMPIVVKNNLVSGGEVAHIPLITALQGSGTGTGTLVGNEEQMINRNYDLKPYWHRHAVAVDEDEKHISSIDLLKAMTDMLKVWGMDETRDDIINSLSSVVESSGAYNKISGHSKEVFYSEATTAQKNTWTAANQYRILFGDSEANYSATHATGLSAVDAAADRLTTANLSLMKKMARRRQRTKTGGSNDVPSLRPIRTGTSGKEFFVVFTGSGNFAKLKTDTAMTAANRDARPRDVDSNPLFQDGDLLWDGMVIREIPEIQATSATVEPAYLLGAQALGQMWAVRPKSTERREDDYQFIKGVGVKMKYSIEKLRYQPNGGSDAIDHGMITGFFYTS